ncbi:amidohydrolase family protein [Pseudoruegeria sp. HB172150]|uniref:amidohydrolase family protein n=1 Tax=Pseudoruegeria sp. HB172150 TaxID=2721164 RepID=UPI00155793AE|nr:amidohydrolase family protein [Pseudoruegeria sp. HB172150]
MADTVLERQPETESEAALTVVDCDIHPGFTTKDEILGYLPQKYRDYARDFGVRPPNSITGALAYPRMGLGMRQDAFPPGGGAAASDLDFMREQHLDPLNIEIGILQSLSAGPSLMDLDFSAAYCAAMNDWQIDKWCSKEDRLRGTMVLPQEDTPAAVRELEERAGDKRFCQVGFVPRGMEPSGRRRYWPIFEAAEAHGMPVAMHTAPFGWRENTGGGNASFYIEEHYAVSNAIQSSLISLIFEGVFERFPNLKLVLVEGGFAWLVPLMWRMDREWERMRDEVPHVKQKPSEYVRRQVWLTTQPVEEPPRVADMKHLIRWLGADKLMFSSDYPHWDFDDPTRAFKIGLKPEEKQAILRDNARAVYGF